MNKRHEKNLEGKSLSEIADFMADSELNSRNAHIASAEFLLREAEFAERMAKAAEETARQTMRYTKLMFWSVALLATSVISSVIIDLIRLYLGR